MMFIAATNVVASRPPECRPTGTPYARANQLITTQLVTSQPLQSHAPQEIPICSFFYNVKFHKQMEYLQKFIYHTYSKKMIMFYLLNSCVVHCHKTYGHITVIKTESIAVNQMSSISSESESTLVLFTDHWRYKICLQPLKIIVV